MEKEDKYMQNGALRAEVMKVILDEARQLSPPTKEIFQLLVVEGLSIWEVARTLNTTVDEVRVRKAKTMHELHRALLKKGIRLTPSRLDSALCF